MIRKIFNKEFFKYFSYIVNLSINKQSNRIFLVHIKTLFFHTKINKTMTKIRANNKKWDFRG